MKPGPWKKDASRKSIEIELFSMIFKYLYRQNEVFLSQLIADLGIQNQIAEPAIELLMRNGFIRCDQGAGISNGDTRITLRDDNAYFIGVDLGGTKLYGGVANLAGKILFDIEMRHNGKSGEACYEMLIEVLDLLLEKAEAMEYRIRGIGIQVPGAFNWIQVWWLTLLQ